MRGATVGRGVVSVLVLACAAAAGGDGDEKRKPLRVSTFEELREALASCSAGDEIVLAPGKYHVTRSLRVGKPDVVVRGQTGKPGDVVLHGDGMNTNTGPRACLSLAADGVELRDLTIRDFWQYGVMLSGRRSRRALPDRLVLHNLRIENCGTRHIKGVDSRDYSEGVRIEKVHCRQTVKYRPRPGHPVDSRGCSRGSSCPVDESPLTETCTSRPSSRRSTGRSPSEAVTSAARADRAFISASRPAGSMADPSSAAVRRVCSSPAEAAVARSSRSCATYVERSMTP